MCVVLSSYERSKDAEAPLNISQLLPVSMKDRDGQVVARLHVNCGTLILR